jgi:PhnB protein
MLFACYILQSPVLQTFIFTHRKGTIIMASASVYLNFSNQTEEAFNFFKSVFGGEFRVPGIMRFKDVPPAAGMPPLAKEDENLVMHIELPLPGGLVLMGSDAPASMGFNVVSGNNVHLNIMPDTRAETKRLFDALAAGGKVTMELQDMFWGDYYGTCTDKYGVQWMFNCAEK